MFVTGAGAPPDSETLYKPSKKPGANTMTPCGLQVPPRPKGASQRGSAGPPSTAIFFSFRSESEKKAIHRPSGDQNGNVALSVPSSACAVKLFSDRTQMREMPLASVATKASFVPSALSVTGPE